MVVVWGLVFGFCLGLSFRFVVICWVDLGILVWICCDFAGVASVAIVVLLMVVMAGCVVDSSGGRLCC